MKQKRYPSDNIQRKSFSAVDRNVSKKNVNESIKKIFTRNDLKPVDINPWNDERIARNKQKLAMQLKDIHKPSHQSNLVPEQFLKNSPGATRFQGKFLPDLIRQS